MPHPGEVVLIPFPYTDLATAKRRLVLVLRAVDIFGDFLGVGVTSQAGHKDAVALTQADFRGRPLQAELCSHHQAIHTQRAHRRTPLWRINARGLCARACRDLYRAWLPTLILSVGSVRKMGETHRFPHTHKCSPASLVLSFINNISLMANGRGAKSTQALRISMFYFCLFD